jgi:hypothetical protein
LLFYFCFSFLALPLISCLIPFSSLPLFHCSLWISILRHCHFLTFVLFRVCEQGPHNKNAFELMLQRRKLSVFPDANFYVVRYSLTESFNSIMRPGRILSLRSFSLFVSPGCFRIISLLLFLHS